LPEQALKLVIREAAGAKTEEEIDEGEGDDEPGEEPSGHGHAGKEEDRRDQQEGATNRLGEPVWARLIGTGMRLD
jgi:hypothetical protein